LKELSFLNLIYDDLERVEALLREHPPGRHEAIGIALDHLLGSGGKRIRPALVLLSAYLCGADMDQAIFPAAAIEMLHTATLIHDDLIDDSLMRRGMETLNSHWPPAVTVLTGDYIFARAAHLAAQIGNVRLMQRFAETLMVICNGEVRQMFDKQSGLTGRHARARYEQRIDAKTGSLIAMSSETGAILSGMDGEAAQALRTYGKYLGLAFQIVDDVLDFVADEETLGKPVGSDLRQGLVTLPVLLFLEAEPDHPTIYQVLQGNLSEEAVQAAVQAVVGSPAIEQALDVARKHADQAKAALNRFSHNPYRAALLDLVGFTVDRRF
jgi:geranylgeranyl pyrophosphate synthase